MDALRGIAAMAVVFYHFGSRLGAPTTVAHGYLAVDFFFMLSGFVLAHAYTEKFPSLTLGRFTLIRIVRLLPMSVLGVLMGTAYLVMRWKVQPAASDSLPQILGGSGLNLALIPKLWSAGATGDELFPANGVLWSLSFEFLINVVWAAALVRLKPLAQIGLALIGGALTAYYIAKIGNDNLGWNWSTYLGGGADRLRLPRWRRSLAF
jgi:peptidoglycan/LPS O-acetylase OafA/YrhL